jgi:hypothetical protein
MMLQVQVKQLYSEAGMVSGLPAVGITAAALWHMSDEALQRAFVYVSHGSSSPLSEHSEVGCGTYIANNAGMRIASSVQIVREAIDVWSAEASTKAAQSLWCSEMSFEQVQSPVCGLPDPAASR